MPAPDKSKKPKKLDKSKKGEAPRKKKGGSSNLLIILSVVGVVVLLGVGITLFMLFSGGDKTPLPGPSGNQIANNAGNQAPTGGSEEGAAQPNIGELTTKASELADSLTDAAKTEEAGKKLREMLDSDVVNKIQGGRNAVLNAIRDKALAGNDASRQFIRELSRDSSNATLAQAALRIYEDSLKQAGEKDDAMVTSVGEEPTNYLPNRTDVVFQMHLSKFLNSEYNKGIFATGAFQKEDIDKSLGIPANTVEQVVLGGMKDHNQVVGIIRTTSPYNWEDVKKTMQLSESGNTIKGKTYYIGKIDFLSEILGQRIPGLDALRDKAAFWRVDVKTLVYADEVSMKDLLENPPTVEKILDPPSSAPLPGATSGSGSPPEGPTGGISAGGIGGAVNVTPGQPGGGAGAASALGDESAQKQNTGGSTGSVMLSASRVERFRTLDGKMRRLIKYTEDAKVDSLCLFTDKATSKVPVLVDYMIYLNRLPSVRNKEIDTVAVALPAVTGSPSLRVGVACRSRGVVREITNDIEKLMTSIGKEDLHDIFGFDFKLKQVAAFTEDQQAAVGGGVGGQSGGSLGRSTLGGKGGLAPGPGGGAGAPGLVSGGGAGGAQGITGGGFGTGLASEGSSGAPNLAGGLPPGQQTAASTDNEPSGSLAIERAEEYIIITASVKSSLSDFTEKHMKGWMQQIRGRQELASGKFRFGDLAASLEYLKADLTRNNRPLAFPYGAHPRTFDAERGPRPYPAHERVSFFRELLPYLGDDRYFSMRESIDPERSWRSTSNLEMARIVVPHFLNPSAGTSSMYVNMHGIEQPLAATHFVGMAGVGPDAAYLPKSDPRAGIFGYDRQTSPDDVKDGLSNTIFMIEADKALLGPWLAGGGSSVRGTSMAGNDVGRRGGFSSPSYSGKNGVWVMMADGSTRFLSKDVSPEVFKALCTMNGSDSAGAIDLIANRVNLEVSPRGNATTAANVTKKKRLVEEEEAPVKK